jgi:hypothetical protein
MAASGFAVTITLTPTDSSGAFKLAGVREQRGRRLVSRERGPRLKPDASSAKAEVP